MLADEKAATAVGFLRRALAFYAAHGITVQRVMTDNGPAYRSLAHTLACRALGLRHLRTRPYRPRTNGKAERFIRTLLAGWAYGAIYASSPATHRRAGRLARPLQLPTTPRRPQPPAPGSRLAQLTGNNLLGSYS